MKRTLSLLTAGAMLLLMMPQAILADNQVGVLSNFATVPVAGLSAEGVANRGQTYYVSTIGFTATDGTMFVFNNKGDLTGSFTLPGLPVVGQSAIYTDDLFVVACSGTLSGGAVVKIDLTTGAVNTGFATIPSGCPNGLTTDVHGNLYAADFAGSIDKVTQSGQVTLNWATGGLLIPGTIGGFTIGPNDIIYNQQQNALYTTNTGTNTVVKIQISQDGSAGAMSAYAAVPGPDGLAFDAHGDLFVTSPFTNTIFLVAPGGSSVTPMTFTGTEALDGPSAVILHGNDLYITNLNLALSHSSGYVSVVPVRFPGS
jgi:SMP-30/gluconolaconase/LRE-like protein